MLAFRPFALLVTASLAIAGCNPDDADSGSDVGAGIDDDSDDDDDDDAPDDDDDAPDDDDDAPDGDPDAAAPSRNDDGGARSADAGADFSPGDAGIPSDEATNDAGSSTQADSGTVDPPPGFEAAQLVTVGTEGVIVGGAADGSLIPGSEFAMDEGYAVNTFAFSRDGAVVWFTLYDEFAEAGDQFQIWSIDSDGGNAQQSALPLPDNWGFPAGFELSVSEDGEVAFLVVPIGIPAAVLPDRELEIYRATERGGAFALVGTTEDEQDFDDLGLAQAVYPKATADGLTLILNGGSGIWSFSQGDGWVPFKIGDKNEIFWNGEPPPGNARFRGLDIDSGGGKWITSLQFGEPDFPWAVITGTSIPLTTIEEVRPEQTQVRVELDDFGEAVAYTFNGANLGEATSIVGEQGGVQRILTTDVDAVVDVALSGNGQWLHAVNKPNSFETVHTSFFEEVTSGNGRVKAHSQAFGGEGIQGGLLNDVGNVMVASVNIGDNVIGTSGLWAMFRNEMGRAGYPELLDVGYRFDEAENLVLRVEATAPDTITSVYVLPLYERYVDPIVPLPSSEENPFFSLRFGAGLAPVEGTPGVYERTVAINRTLLDERFSLRAVVVSGPNEAQGNKAAFGDFFLE